MQRDCSETDLASPWPYPFIELNTHGLPYGKIVSTLEISFLFQLAFL